MAETSSLLRNRTFIRTEGSNPSLSAIDICVSTFNARADGCDEQNRDMASNQAVSLL